MAKLTTAKRNNLKESTFALPEQRKYPIPDRNHAIAAKSRATQQYRAGNLSAGERDTVMRKANAKLRSAG